jgi:Protein of unknown function (DUF1573)
MMSLNLQGRYHRSRRRTSFSGRVPKSFVVVVFAGILFAACGADQGSQPEPEMPRECIDPPLVLSEEELDFGDIDPKQDHERVISLENTGNEPIAVEMVRSSCPCIKPEATVESIPPGEVAELRVKLALKNYPSDKVKGHVLVKTNLPEPPVFQVAVQGKIIPEYTVEPGKLDFGSVKRGKPTTRTLVVTQTGPEELVLKSVETSEGLTATFKERPAKPEKPEQPKTYDVAVTLTPNARAQRVQGSLTLITAIARIPKWKVRVRAKITGIECVIAPKVVVFDATPGTKEPVAHIDIENALDFEVRDIACTNQAVQATLVEPGPRTRHRIALKLGPEARAGSVLGKVTFTVVEGKLSEPRQVAVCGSIGDANPEDAGAVLGQ